MFVFEGDAGVDIKYSGTLLDTVISVASALYSPKGLYQAQFISGTTALVAEAQLTGGSSGAVIQVKDVVIGSGSLAGNNATGVIFYNIISGTPTAGGESYTACTTLDMGILCQGYGKLLSSIFIQCELANVRFLYNGASPTNSGATPASRGFLLETGKEVLIVGQKSSKNLKFINAASGNESAVNAQFNYV